MQNKDCFLVGTVFKLHGYKGDVNIYNDDDIPFNFSSIKYFLINLDNNLIPFFVDRVRSTKPNIILVKFKDINSEKEAKKILKKAVFLPNELSLVENNNGFTEKQLLGFTIIDIKMGELGKITYINSQTAQQLIYVNKDGKEFCFPKHEQFIKKIDVKEKIMEVEISKELLDLN
ncbi:MAG: 16S rRNA processing protein RimM [Flavobacteriales bacterium]|jgi:16S rRNA processing protein RimM|nr:16S rRNA processing protein RimM [Flavobacteriales bacterium]